LKKKLLRLLLIRIPVWFVVLSLLLVTALKWVPVWYTPLMARRAVELRDDGRYRFERKWKPLEEISPEMVKAVIASEDNRFGTHRGFDWVEMEKMWKDHSSKGKKLRGCSTISQQTAKNVFTSGSQTWIRKGFEAYWTVLIEWIWGKRRIMEVYLNVVELGPGIYGVEAASQHFYGTRARNLDRKKAVSLAVVLPSPLTYSPDAPTGYLRKRQSAILSLIPKIGYPEWIPE